MARKRPDDLLVDAHGWLSEDDAVQSRLGTAGEVVTYGQASDPDGDPDLAPVAVAVTVIPGSSDRDNQSEDMTAVVEVEVSASNTYVEANGTLELTRLAGDVHDVMTTHRDGWTAEGASGGSGAVSPDPDRPRYSAVRRFDVSKRNTAAAHD